MGLPPFKNEPLTDFTNPDNRRKMEDAVKCVREKLLGKDWPLWIDGKEVRTKSFIARHNPGKNDELIGRVCAADQKLAQQAVDAATEAFKSWSKVPGAERARYLLRAAAVIKRERYKYMAVEALESGKNWPEADGDVAETIDFLEFYARRMIEIDQPHPTETMPGEENNAYWIPIGPCLSIPPWNFPLAIMAGMTTACIVAGNTVILKPSSQAPIVAALFCELMHELRLPPGVLNFCPGSSRDIGDFLVDHPKIRLVTFTGSMDVGCRIHERAGKVNAGQIWLKRVIAEMGGKDAILVDDDCNLEAAADAIVASAFGFQGQKCSACSRVIAHQKIHDELLAMVVERTKKLAVGPAWEGTTQVACVAEEASYKNILNYIEAGKKEGQLECGGKPAKVKGCAGYYIEPTIFSGVKPKACIHCEEIFGPVLAFVKCKNFDHGLEIVNSTIYGLTGSAFTNRRENLEKARRDFHVGNLYLNRKCTGAFVGVHPFGGFNMSGTDDKAGGREHLYRFLQAKSVSEKL